MSKFREISQDDLVSLLRARFGADTLAWAFECPSCGDVATGADLRAALADRPRTRRDGSAVMASDLLGQECIGRTLGALAKEPVDVVRGCDWAAYGLLRGPWKVTRSEGEPLWCFPVAEAA